MKLRAAAVIFALATPCAFSQLTIENPRHLDVPEAQARVLFQMSFQAVAKELRPGQKASAEFPLHLVIGQEEDRFGLDAKTGVPTLSLLQVGFTRGKSPKRFPFLPSVLRALEWTFSSRSQSGNRSN